VEANNTFIGLTKKNNIQILNLLVKEGVKLSTGNDKTKKEHSMFDY